jgi:hypothetical protein
MFHHLRWREYTNKKRYCGRWLTMAYYPYYVPDTYLLAVKYIPNTHRYYRVKEVDSTARLHKEQDRLKRRNKLTKNLKRQKDKGLYFDQYA